MMTTMIRSWHKQTKPQHNHFVKFDSFRDSQIGGNGDEIRGEQGEARSLQCKTRSYREASISATPCRVVHAGAETSTEDKLGFVRVLVESVHVS
ncbi:hypothetical protein F2Q68_00008593 [Brassica cretica]|uniref:Uncharacterized protein n=1 Tax=Brassica cretica TaxID=69181 RepID=A0A8S9L4P4_BRACR|nr:hypothetical protein F2Q68_00008593 [Brassica cretica]